MGIESPVIQPISVTVLSYPGNISSKPEKGFRSSKAADYGIHKIVLFLFLI
jgi:hypothetical protein